MLVVDLLIIVVRQNSVHDYDLTRQCKGDLLIIRRITVFFKVGHFVLVAFEYIIQHLLSEVIYSVATIGSPEDKKHCADLGTEQYVFSRYTGRIPDCDHTLVRMIKETVDHPACFPTVTRFYGGTYAIWRDGHLRLVQSVDQVLK